LLAFRDDAFAALLLVLDLAIFDAALPGRFGADVFRCNLVLDAISSPLSTFSIA
jgi:hypothetical protein